MAGTRTMTADISSSVARADGRRLMIALDIDGTVTAAGSMDVPAPVVAAVGEARRAGHHIVLASGRSLVGVLPIARRLGLTDGWAVASNGAVTARLTAQSPGHLIDFGTDVQTLDVHQVVTAALNMRLPGLQIAVEEVAVGHTVSEPFPDGLLRGEQTVLPVDDLVALASPRVILRDPGVHRLIDPLRRVGLTVIPGPEIHRLDVTPGGVSKATALETVRRRLDITPDSTVAVGDGTNDVEALAWAARGVAMGHAAPAVRAAADEVTGTFEEHGAATILLELTAIASARWPN